MNINMTIYLVDHESERIDYDSKSLPIFEVNRVQAELWKNTNLLT